MRRAVTAVVLALGLAACGGGDAGGVPSSVVVVGDSITVGSEDAIRRELSARGVDTVTVDAEIGRRIAVGDGSTGGPINGVIATEWLLDNAVTGDVWVVALGTNDVGQYGSVEEREAITELLALVPDGAPLVWVDTCLPGREEATARFNANLAEVLAGRPDTTIGTWSAVCAGPGLLLPDRVHPDTPGQQAFAELIADAVTG